MANQNYPSERMTAVRSAEKLNVLINDYLKRKDVFDKNTLWTIKKSHLGGFGVFAKRDIKQGELIFRDSAVILGPRCLEITPEFCVNCFCKTDLIVCPKSCGLLVCSSACENSVKHKLECDLIRQIRDENVPKDITSELMKCLTPLRSLLLSKEDKQVVTHLKAHKGSRHGHEVDVLSETLKFHLLKEEKEFLRFVCAVLDANAFEVVVGNEDRQTSVRGLYPLGSLANHRCYPNAFHVFDQKQRMVVRAAVPIDKDAEIFHCYSRILWGTTTRTFHLKNTKHFVCKCDRCLDPTEFGTYMSAIYCDKCRGRTVPLNPVKRSNWRCEDCKRIVTLKEVGRVLTLIGSVLKGIDDADFKIIYSFLCGKLAAMVPEYNQVVVELKYKIIWILGYKPGYLWKDLSLELLLIKKKCCQDILDVLVKLNVGQCKIRGLVLYELHLCLVEINNKENIHNGVLANLYTYLEEASDILRYDVSAPAIIKERWK